MKLDISNFNKQQEELSAGDIIQVNFGECTEAFIVMAQKGTKNYFRLANLNGKDYLEDINGTPSTLKEKLDMWFHEKGWRYELFSKEKFMLSLSKIDEVRV